MTVYAGSRRAQDPAELKALSVIMRAEKKGLSKCSALTMSRVEKAMMLLTSRGYIVDIRG